MMVAMTIKTCSKNDEYHHRPRSAGLKAELATDLLGSVAWGRYMFVVGCGCDTTELNDWPYEHE